MSFPDSLVSFTSIVCVERGLFIIINNAITALLLLLNVWLASKLDHSKATLQILVNIFAISFVYEKKKKKTPCMFPLNGNQKSAGYTAGHHHTHSGFSIHPTAS